MAPPKAYKGLPFRFPTPMAPPPPWKKKGGRDWFDCFPPELQSRLYETMLVRDKPIRLALTEDEYGMRASFHNPWEIEIPFVNILATCKRIRYQATAFLYSDNSFSFVNDTRALVYFVTQLKQNAIFLRTILVEAPLPFAMFQHAIHSFRTFTHLLTSVTVTVTNRWKMGGEDEMAEAIYPWLKNCIDFRHDLGETVFWDDVIDIIHFTPLERDLEPADYNLEMQHDQRLAVWDFDVTVKNKIKKLIAVEQTDWQGPEDPRADEWYY